MTVSLLCSFEVSLFATWRSVTSQETLATSSVPVRKRQISKEISFVHKILADIVLVFLMCGNLVISRVLKVILQNASTFSLHS